MKEFFTKHKTVIIIIIVAIIVWYFFMRKKPVATPVEPKKTGENSWKDYKSGMVTHRQY